MHFESKSQKLPLSTRQYFDKSKLFNSPDKKSPSASLQDFNKLGKFARGTSTSPRYRSPTHSRLNLESSDCAVLCPTCEKRSGESTYQTFHESPPKIRPSHHNIVCEDCSEGSYSKVLKVVCLNEGEQLIEGTQKIKIIESVGSVSESNRFPVLGCGKNVQVHYQEVFPPPKQELTSLFAENNRNESAFRYQAKEEERKRVAIRRAEYANRIKGVSKTIVTTINSDTDKISRSEGKSIGVKHGEVKYEVDSEDSRDYLKSGEVQRYEIKTGREASVEKNGKKKQQSKSPAKAVTAKVAREEKDEEKKYDLKDSIEYTKLSVKHKILAKLAGKDFKQYIDSVPAEHYDAEANRPTKPDLPADIQSLSDCNISRGLSRCSLVEPEQVPDLNKSEVNYTEDDSLRVEIQSSPSASSKNFIILKGSDPSSAVGSGEGHVGVNQDRASGCEDPCENPENSSQYEIIDDVPVLEYEEQIENIEENKNENEAEKENENKNEIEKEKENVNEKEIEKENENENENDIEKEKEFNSPELIDTHKEEEIVRFVEDEYAPEDELSRESVHQSSPEHAPAGEIDPASSYSHSPEEAKAHLEESEAKSFARSSECDSVNDDTALKHKFDDLSKISFEECEEEVTPNPHSLDHSDENLYKTMSSEPAEYPTRAEYQENSDKLQKITELDEEFQDTPRGGKDSRYKLEVQAQEGQEIRAKTLRLNAPSEEQRKTEAVIDSEKVNMMFMLLTDDKVIKGLRLLGGFADYLEIHGKDILDWKH